MAGKACILAAFALALSPSPAQAECRQWDVSGMWFPKGGGDGHQFDLTQKGSLITGSARRGTAKIAKVSGNVVGSAFYLDIAEKGLSFRGEIRSDGTIHGNVTGSVKGLTAFWTSSRAMKCSETRSNTPAPPQKPVNTAPPSKAPPTISAHPTVVTIPAGQSQGTVTLTWDGGPDHPYAEVWMKEGNQGEEKFLVEQGKGTRQVTVERGKNYQFILTDAGQQLAKAVVISRR